MIRQEYMIRLAVAADVARIGAIVAVAYGGYVTRMGGQLPGPMRDDYAALVEAGQVWLAGDPAMGVLVLRDQPDHLLLDNIAVDPAAQGSGVGRALLQFADAAARQRGYAELRLYTHETMVENIALYKRLGWQETGRATQAGLHRVFFRKPA